MKFSEQWLREWVNPGIDTQELTSQVTMAGLEVDSIEPVSGVFSGVIVGLVEQVESHPDADKLKVCQVSAGENKYQVVCGAPNVREGLKVPFAILGAVLPGSFKIKKIKLRGVESHGMLCSESELGLSDMSSGLMELPDSSPVGEDFRAYLQLDDVSIDIDLTPNRGDCLSIAGIAREVGVLNKLAINTPEIVPVPPVNDSVFNVNIEAPAACPRYLGRVIKGVDTSVNVPLWMKEKLRRSGLRSIDPAVDVTNYVLLELGQPMHAFDLDKLTGSIQVRMARQGEELTLLDGQNVQLSPDTLLIADEDGPLAMAGIMGGEDSGITEVTTNLFLECAYFNPLVVAGKARQYGLHTDASHRYERGVDYDLQYKAMDRATQLIIEILGGEPGPVTASESLKDLPDKLKIKLRDQRLEQLLGLKIDRTEVEEILSRLGLHIEKLTVDGWLVSVPSYRFDISIEADLIEEVGRIYGYNNLPVTKPVGKLSLVAQNERQTPVELVREHLVTLGYQEIISYSFVQEALQNRVNPGMSAVALANPISPDLAIMRTSLWPGLLNALSFNLKRQQSRLRFFETGLRFVEFDGKLQQKLMLSGAITGKRFSENWSQGQENIDFFDIKGDLESLFQRLGGKVEFTVGHHKGLHPKQSAEIVKNNHSVGIVGCLHPEIQKSENFIGRVYLFELCLNEVIDGFLPFCGEISKFPAVRRDIALVVPEVVEFGEIKKVIMGVAGEWLRELILFDVYMGSGVPQGFKSLAMGLIWQHKNRTLNDEDIDIIFEKIMLATSEKFRAKLRS